MNVVRDVVRRKEVLILLRLTILCLIMLPALTLSTDIKKQVVVCFDFSRSVNWLCQKQGTSIKSFYITKLRKIRENLNSGDQLAVICFAQDGNVVKRFTDVEYTLSYTENIESSNLNKALGLALSLFQQTSKFKKIVHVYSDGFIKDVNPHLHEEFQKYSADLNIHYLFTKQIKNQRDIAISKMRWPRSAKMGQVIRGSVVVSTSHKTHAEISLRNNRN